MLGRILQVSNPAALTNFAPIGVEGRDETETVRAMRIQRMTDAPKGWHGAIRFETMNTQIRMTKYYRDDVGPIHQRCPCGAVVRTGDHGCDYIACKKKCPTCGKLVLCGPIVMVDRFSGLEQIFAEHRIQGVHEYRMSSLPHPPNFPVFDEEFDGPFES